MNYLTLGDIWLALNDLLDRRLGTLQISKICQVYEPIFREELVRLNALPRSVITSRPLSEQLAEQDTLHDDSLGTIWFTIETVLRNPRASKELKQTAQEILDETKISLGDINEGYAEEAIKAKEREEKLTELAPKLALFTLSGGGTLNDAAIDYLTAGKALGALLSERTSQEAMSEEDRRAVSLMRPAIVGLIGRCRKALADEIRRYPTLPRNLDAQIFGYFDELNQLRLDSNRAAQEVKTKVQAESRAKAAIEAQLKAAEAQVKANVKAQEAQAAKQKADEAAAEATKRAEAVKESSPK